MSELSPDWRLSLVSELSPDWRLSLGSVLLNSNRRIRPSSFVMCFRIAAARAVLCWVEVVFICVLVLL